MFSKIKILLPNLCKLPNPTKIPDALILIKSFKFNFTLANCNLTFSISWFLFPVLDVKIRLFSKTKQIRQANKKTLIVFIMYLVYLVHYLEDYHSNLELKMFLQGRIQNNLGFPKFFLARLANLPNFAKYR